MGIIGCLLQKFNAIDYQNTNKIKIMRDKLLILKLSQDIADLFDTIDEKNNTIQRLSLNLVNERSEHKKQINEIKENCPF